ncbi:MAG: NRAMP family divalent metal transporter, partial [Ktedonobacterales bacterium]
VAGAHGQGARLSLRMLGPGLLGGMAGNDSAAVTSYSMNGATNGYGQLWLLLLATPLYQAVQYACAKIGRVNQRGLATLLHEQYGRSVAVLASLLLLVANGALIAADLAAIGSGLQLITGISWDWFVVPVALILWYLTVYQSFGMIKKVFIGMSLAFVAYLIAGIFSGANWGMALKDTFIPQINFGFAGISSAVALLGATVSPYTMYWQVQGEKEESRPGPPKTQFALASADIAAGTISGNLVAYFIIVCTSATLFTHHQQIQTAADAARALEPMAGPFATYLFAIGLIGAGLVAIPVLLASSSYAVAGTFGWPASLWKKPWQNEGFYLILTAALSVSLVVALLGFDPIQLMFWANVLQGVLAPSLVVLILLLGNKRTVMKSYRFGKLINVALGLMALIMFAAVALLFYGLLTGQAH